MIVVYVIVGYVLIGIGVGRFVFTREYKRLYPVIEAQTKNRHHHRYLQDPHAATVGHEDAIASMLIPIPLWPFFVVWFLLIKPIGTVIWPLLAKWYTAPARKAVSS